MKVNDMIISYSANIDFIGNSETNNNQLEKYEKKEAKFISMDVSELDILLFDYREISFRSGHDNTCFDHKKITSDIVCVLLKDDKRDIVNSVLIEHRHIKKFRNRYFVHKNTKIIGSIKEKNQ